MQLSDAHNQVDFLRSEKQSLEAENARLRKAANPNNTATNRKNSGALPARAAPETPFQTAGAMGAFADEVIPACSPAKLHYVKFQCWTAWPNIPDSLLSKTSNFHNPLTIEFCLPFVGSVSSQSSCPDRREPLVTTPSFHYSRLSVRVNRKALIDVYRIHCLDGCASS